VLGAGLVHERLVEIGELPPASFGSIASIALRSWAFVFSRTTENVSQDGWSAGIDVAASHLPLANFQKSCCGRTSGSMAARSMPDRCSAASAAGTIRPIIKANANFANMRSE
jgi:hypothetical protein